MNARTCGQRARAHRLDRRARAPHGQLDHLPSAVRQRAADGGDPTGADGPFAYVQTFLPSLTDETNLYVMQDNGTSLYKVDEANAASPPTLGSAVGHFTSQPPGDWANATAMTANAADGRLYIADGADSSHYRVFRVDPANGNWLHGYSAYFSNPQFTTTINGVPYLMKSQVIYRLSSSADTHTQNVKLNGIGSGSWGYTVTGMVGRDDYLDH